MDVSGILDAAQFLALLRKSVDACEESQAQLKACTEQAEIMRAIQKTELEIVAVGAMATQLELRMPCALMRLRRASQSIVLERSTSTKPPRC